MHKYFVSYMMVVLECGWRPCNIEIIRKDPIRSMEDIEDIEKQIYDKEDEDKDVAQVKIVSWRKFEDFE